MSQVNKTQITESLKAHLALLQESGIDFMPKPKKPTAAKKPELIVSEEGWAGLTIDNASLRELRQEIGDCKRCPLNTTRNHIVFGEGAPQTDIMFVGEAPGADEDMSGRPFVGRAGKLLTDMIEKGMGLPRSSIYIANICKCRPPENRNPAPEEIAACSPFLKKQIALIKPKVIIALGKFAAQTLLQTETPITKLRGTFHDYEGTKLMPTYHPAYLLRNPPMKKAVWEDLQIVMRYLGIPLPKK